MALWVVLTFLCVGVIHNFVLMLIVVEILGVLLVFLFACAFLALSHSIACLFLCLCVLALGVSDLSLMLTMGVSDLTPLR